ncbi:MAG: tRNA (adenosine(37)-N6)-threonylcarbamoyltransferase complex dimerization subunit type 1 TsaB [Acidimicrobiia bacterium]
MRILAIETATPASSVALGEDAEVLAMSLQVNRRGHVGFLVPAIEFCFASTGWSPRDLDLVAVDVGPGPYTGIRAGISVAQGVAAAVGVPIMSMSSLTVLALRAATGRRQIWPIVDVRRGEVATAPFSPVPGGVVRDGATEVVTAEALCALVDSSPTEALLVGDWKVLPDAVFKGMHRAKTGRPRYPSADVMLEIATIRAGKEDYASPEDIRPIYLRDADAAINWSEFREEGVWPGAAS